MNNNDFILPRKSGTSPVKLLFDKSLMLARKHKEIKVCSKLSQSYEQWYILTVFLVA